MFWKKSYFKFALNVFFMKKLKSAILSQNHRRSQGDGPGVKKSYFNPIFTNIFNKRFSKTNIFFQKLSKTIFSFSKTIFFHNKHFFQILHKSSSGWGLRPQTPIATGGCGLRPRTFEYTSFLNTYPKLDIFAF